MVLPFRKILYWQCFAVVTIYVLLLSFSNYIYWNTLEICLSNPMVKVFLIKSILLRAMHVGELYKMVGSCLWKKKWKNRITSSDNACLYPIWQHQNPTPHSQIFTPVDISKQILHVLVNVNSAILVRSSRLVGSSFPLTRGVSGMWSYISRLQTEFLYRNFIPNDMVVCDPFISS